MCKLRDYREHWSCRFWGATFWACGKTRHITMAYRAKLPRDAASGARSHWTSAIQEEVCNVLDSLQVLNLPSRGPLQLHPS